MIKHGQMATLNCPNNTEMMRALSFKGQLIPPCGNAGGQFIGMALEYFNKCLLYFNFKHKNAYFGGCIL